MLLPALLALETTQLAVESTAKIQVLFERSELLPDQTISRLKLLYLMGTCISAFHLRTLTTMLVCPFRFLSEDYNSFSITIVSKNKLNAQTTQISTFLNATQIELMTYKTERKISI
jgi:hypothetical protein